MTLEAITRTLRLRAEAEVAAIRDDARERVEAQYEAARALARREGDAARAAAQAPSERECALARQRARLEAAKARAEATQSLVRESMRQAAAALSQVRQRGDYPLLVRRLLAETIAELQGSAGGGTPPQILADERDRPLVERALADLGVPVYVAYGLECWGGVNGRSADGLVTVDNTVEVRLEAAAPVLERHLAAIFEARDPAAALAQLGRSAPQLVPAGAAA